MDDDRGDWEGAVAKATQTTAGSSNALFKQFGEENNAVIESAAAQFRSSIDAASDTSSALARLVAFVGLFALGVCFVAMTPRLREYR